MENVPIHESQAVYGVSESCKFNDHYPICMSPRCGCSCHRQSRVEADNDGVNRVVASQNRPTSIQTGLDKYCPICKGKAPFDQFYCKKDGSKLSSLRCPECQTPGEQDDNYCGHCGCSMKVTDRELEAAATGQQVEDIPVTGDPEAAMREAMAAYDNKVKDSNPSKISDRMFK